jgi:4-aminobutyrate aminotransferase/(S)-3-amino-2-methylpropionate transaminase
MSANASLHQRRGAAVPRGVGNAFAVYAKSANNSEIVDEEGKKYRSPAPIPSAPA